MIASYLCLITSLLEHVDNHSVRAYGIKEQTQSISWPDVKKWLSQALSVSVSYPTLFRVFCVSLCHGDVTPSSRFTIYRDACTLSCVNAEACLTGWPNAWVAGVGEVS